MCRPAHGWYNNHIPCHSKAHFVVQPWIYPCHHTNRHMLACSYLKLSYFSDNNLTGPSRPETGSGSSGE